MRNKILQITRNTIPYVKQLRPIAGSVAGTLLMQQLDFWFAMYPHGFYKFLEPCPTSKHYKKGKSWVEELGVSADEFRTAFDKIGIRYKSKSAYEAVEQKFGEALYCSYFDKQQGLTFYFRNHAVVDALLDKLISGAETVEERGVDEGDEESSTVAGQSPSTVNQGPDSSTGNGDSPSPVDGRSLSTGDGQLPFTGNGQSPSTGDGHSPSPVNREGQALEMGTPDLCSLAIPISRDGQCPSPVYINNKEITEENTQENTHRKAAGAAVGVGVKSKFSLEECLRYARHLWESKQGITNPGGYATIIHRSGEADPLIEQFLHSARPPMPAETMRCPDCQGTGFVYPNGFGQGVRKCQHPRLTSSSTH